jgi:putative copper resistance protein D
MPDWSGVQTGVVALQDLAFALLAGCLGCAAMLAPQAARMPGAPEERLRRGARAAVWLLVVAHAGNLVLQGSVVAATPPWSAQLPLGAVLLKSRFGTAWLAALPGLVVLAAVAVFAPTSRLAWLGCVAYAAGRADIGHAADATRPGLAVAVQATHLLATALWAGPVFVGAALLRRARAAPSGSGAAIAVTGFCERLSYFATLAFVVVVTTGLYNAIQNAGLPAAGLSDSAYLRLLALKIGLVVIAAALGGYNRMATLPRLSRGTPGTPGVNDVAARCDADRAADAFTRLLIAEALVMTLVLLAAGVLGHTSPGPDSPG